MDFFKARQQAEKKHMRCIFISLRKNYFTLGILASNLYIFQRSTETARDLLCKPLFSWSTACFVPCTPQQPARGEPKEPSPGRRGQQQSFSRGWLFSQKAERCREDRSSLQAQKVLRRMGCYHQNDICKTSLLLWLRNCSAKRKSCKPVTEGKEFAT